MMMMIMMMIIIIIIIIINQETMKSRNYRKQPYWHCTHNSERTNVKVQ